MWWTAGKMKAAWTLYKLRQEEEVRPKPETLRGGSAPSADPTLAVERIGATLAVERIGANQPDKARFKPWPGPFSARTSLNSSSLGSGPLPFHPQHLSRSGNPFFFAQVKRGSTSALRRSTLDFCLGGQRSFAEGMVQPTIGVCFYAVRPLHTA